MRFDLEFWGSLWTLRMPKLTQGALCQLECCDEKGCSRGSKQPEGLRGLSVNTLSSYAAFYKGIQYPDRDLHGM